MIQEIKYTGFTATPSDYECPDGELDAAINLVPEDGELKATKEGEVLLQLPTDQEGIGVWDGYIVSYKIKYIHKNASYKHLILEKVGVSDGLDNKCQLFWVELPNEGTTSEALSSLADEINYNPIPKSYSCESGQDLNVKSIGNTIIVNGSKDGRTHYALWAEGGYKYLGDHLPEIYLSFGLRGKIFRNTHNIEDITYASALINSDNVYTGILLSTQSSGGIEETKRISNEIIAQYNIVLSDAKYEGYFTHPFFVRYALRLYDGSLVMHSAPILMTPSTSKQNPVYAAKDIEAEDTGGENYYQVRKINGEVCLLASVIDYKFLDTISDAISNWGDVVKSVDIFVSNEIYKFDPSGEISGFGAFDSTEPVFVGTPASFSRGTIRSAMVGRSGQSLGIPGKFYFISNENRYGQWRFCDMYSSGGHVPSIVANNPSISDEEFRKRIENTHNFYFLCSISLGELSSSSREVLDYDRGHLSSLTTHEEMGDDYHSHDYLRAKYIQDYNNRLNVSGIKRELFNGFPLQSMLAYCADRYNVAYETTPIHTGGRGNGGRTVVSRTVTAAGAYDNYVVEVTLNIDGTEKKVVCELGSSTLYGIYIQDILSDEDSNDVLKPDSWGNYFYYPDRHATKIRIIHKGNGEAEPPFHNSGEYFEIALTPHNHLNGAYAFIDYNTVKLKTGDVSSIPSQRAVVIDELGKIYTSDANNPFKFSTTNINTIGTGEVLGICTAAKALSQGQFGQFPLYAFTTEGVWALEVSSTGSFSAKQPITRDVCINAESITQLDNAVLFATDRGIMLLSGSDSICITDSINSDTVFKLITADTEDNADLLPGLDKLVSSNDGIATAADIVPFKMFLPSARMLYDYVHQRIIVYNPEHTYAYVYSLKSKSWGMMQSNIKYGINSYPECLAIDNDNNIINLSSVPEVLTENAEASTRNCLLITRPLKFDQPDVLKTIDSVIQRGQFRKGSVQSILYGSRDLFHWHLVASSRDHYLRGFRGTPYKYFRIVLLAKLQKDESIFGCTIGYAPRLLDQLR